MKRKKGFMSIEILTVLFISICLIVPLGMWMQQNNLRFITESQGDTIKLDVQFLLADIETAWIDFHYDYSKTEPVVGSTESKICFKNNEGHYIRYYRKGNQIGKDRNWSTFENITLRVISDFRVTQIQDEDTVIMKIFIKDILGRRYSKLLLGKK